MSDIDTARAENSERGDVVATFPCTQTQMRCWFLDQLSPGNPALNVAVRWEIRGAFTIAGIEAAFRKVVERHEILRTRFVEADGQPVQQVVAAVDFKMSVIDLRHVARDKLDERIRSISKETAAIPFDLAQPGLLRVTFLMAENRRGFILITAHQTCFDGWSIRVLGREVGEIAAAIDAQRTPVLPELPLQYGDFALWQNEYRNSYGFETEKAYWREQLAGAPYFELPPDRPRGRGKTSRGDIVSETLSPAFGARMEEAARAQRVSLFSYGAAVVSAALHRHTGARDILIGTQIAGREEVDLENLVGVFINNLVLRFDMAQGRSFADHLQRVSETVANALKHQKMPFNNLVEMINPVRDPARNPLVSINFNQQKAFLENAHYGDFELISAPSQSPGVIYDLNFIMIGRPDGWRMSVEYNADLFEASTARALLTLWKDTYRLALERPAAPLATALAPDGANGAEAQRDPDLGRLEAALRACPGIAEAAAFVPSGSARPYAVVVPAPDFGDPLEALPERVMRHLGARLPEAEMPGSVSVRLALPHAAEGTAGMPEPPQPQTARPGPAPAGSGALAETQDRLGAIWARVLGVDKVEAGDDFFALGGHSLLALRLFAAMHETFGTRPDLALLFRAPTLERFTREVFGEANAEAGESVHRAYWETSVYRQGESPLTVYTLNHPFLYYRMAEALPRAASVVNLHMLSAGIDEALRARTLEQIVGDAIAAMKLGPGPQTLAIVGLCVNGILAAEMARQLHRLGHDVRFAALIDSWAPGYVRSLPRLRRWRWNAEKRVKRLAYFTGRLLAGRIRLLTYLKEFDVTLRLVGRLSKNGAMNAEEQASAEVTALLVEAARGYRPKPLNGVDVLLLRSQANHRRARGLLFGWRGFVREDTPVFDLKGWHEDSLTAAGIDTLSRVVAERLETGGGSAHRG